MTLKQKKISHFSKKISLCDFEITETKLDFCSCKCSCKKLFLLDIFEDVKIISCLM